jgi:tRNA (guanine-N1)-methyltransferase
VSAGVRAALQELSLPSYILDCSYRIRWLNQAAQELFGNAVGRYGTFIVAPEHRTRARETFTSKLLDFPQYTRPAEFRGMSVPEVLLSGNHAEIEKWRHARQMEKTRHVRPDLLK